MGVPVPFERALEFSGAMDVHGLTGWLSQYLHRLYRASSIYLQTQMVRKYSHPLYAQAHSQHYHFDSSWSLSDICEYLLMYFTIAYNSKTRKITDHGSVFDELVRLPMQCPLSSLAFASAHVWHPPPLIFPTPEVTSFGS